VLRSIATMNKRTFLSLLSGVIAGPTLAPLSAWMLKQKLTNWAGNLVYSTDRITDAASLDQIRFLVRSQDKVKVLGGPLLFPGELNRTLGRR